MSNDLVEQLKTMACPGLCVLFFGLLGVLLVTNAFFQRRKLSSSNAWPIAAGQVIESQVRTLTDYDYVNQVSSTSYSPEVRYTYEVNGQPYLGRWITLGAQKTYSRATDAQAVVDRYPAGRQVTVYYHPQKPAEVVLERQTHNINRGLACGVACLLIAACALFALGYLLVAYYVTPLPLPTPLP